MVVEAEDRGVERGQAGRAGGVGGEAGALQVEKVRDAAREDAFDALAVLRLLTPRPWIAPRYSELYESPIDAGEAVPEVAKLLSVDRATVYRALQRAA